jgi:hypothetical protein
MEVVSRRDDEEWQRHFEEKQRRQNLQEQANAGTFLSVMALAQDPAEIGEFGGVGLASLLEDAKG